MDNIKNISSYKDLKINYMNNEENEIRIALESSTHNLTLDGGWIKINMKIDKDQNLITNNKLRIIHNVLLNKGWVIINIDYSNDNTTIYVNPNIIK
jgi:hypothetical protein